MYNHVFFKYRTCICNYRISFCSMMIIDFILNMINQTQFFIIQLFIDI